MKLHLHFNIEVDEKGLAAYYERYPGFLAEEDRADTFAREASASWDSEGLILQDPTWEEVTE